MADLTREIISSIPSESLKRHLKAVDYRPSDADLLTIAFSYAPDYDTRIRFLQGLEQMLSGELRDYAARVLQLHRPRRRGEVHEFPNREGVLRRCASI